MIPNPVPDATEFRNLVSPNENPTDSQSDAEKHYQILSEGKNKKYVCTLPGCEKIFRFHSEMQRHIAAHSASRPFGCTFEGCTKEFKRKGALDNHVRSQHTGEAPLVCSYPACGLRFSTEAKYRYHTMSHMEEKPYKCRYPQCTKSFLTLSQLKQHERSSSVHKKLDWKCKFEEREDKEEPSEGIDSSENLSDFEKTSTSNRTEPNKMARYDDGNQEVKVMLQEVQTPKVEEIELKEEDNSDPLFEKMLFENGLLKQKLESTEQLLALMSKQINNINARMMETAHLFLPGSAFDMNKINSQRLGLFFS